MLTADSPFDSITVSLLFFISFNFRISCLLFPFWRSPSAFHAHIRFTSSFDALQFLANWQAVPLFVLYCEDSVAYFTASREARYLIASYCSVINSGFKIYCCKFSHHSVVTISFLISSSISFITWHVVSWAYFHQLLLLFSLSLHVDKSDTLDYNLQYD
jgi:hypothetical protein